VLEEQIAMAPTSEADLHDASLMVGRTLRDRWHLDALIDVGGMAAVYAATHRDGTRGAVKMLHVETSHSEDLVRRFRREGQIANKIGHPGALRVIDDAEDDEDGRPFLVMELLEGSTLQQCAIASGGKLPAEKVLLATDQLLDVLAAAHELGIIHRDVKPENVFLTTDGRVKVLDFGIARLPEPSALWRATAVGMPMGTPAFMSPEQARGRWDLVDAQSDLWAVGATMFTLLSGEFVHVESTVPELLAASFTKPARSLATLLPDAHATLVEVVDRALAQRLADRWPDARSMQAAVRDALARLRDPSSARRAPRPSTAGRAWALSLPGARSATTAASAGRSSRVLRLRKGWVASAVGAALVAGAIGVSVAGRDARGLGMTALSPALGAPQSVRQAPPQVISSETADELESAQAMSLAPPLLLRSLPPTVAAQAASVPSVLPATRPSRTMFDRRH
jgi:eukaryotic-like serine/threonine-protein kinase